MPLNRKRSPIFYGWWVVTACFFISVYTSGVVFYGFTSVFEPLRNEFGWSYAQISLAASLRGLEMGLLAPLVGLLVDRWGPRKLLLCGIILIGLGLMLLSRITSLSMFYGVFFIIAIGSSNCSSTVEYTAVANWFRKKVAVATGIVAAGFGLGGLLIPIVTLLVDKFGWQMAMVIFGVGMWTIGLPLALVVRHRPEQYGYLPDGELTGSAFNNQHEISIKNIELDVSARQAVKSRTFWHIALALMCQALSVSAVVTHVMPYLGSIGLTRTTASLAAMAFPLTSIGGRLGFGWLGDIFNKRRLAAIGFTLTSLGLVFFALFPDAGLWLLVLSILFFGIGWGATVTMSPALLRECFGRSQFGTIHGLTVGVLMVGLITGAPLAGWVFDEWGSYQAIWFILAGVSVAALVTILNTPQFEVRAVPRNHGNG